MKIRKVTKCVETERDPFIYVGIIGEDKDHKCFLTNGRSNYLELLEEYKEKGINLDIEFSDDKWKNILKCTPSLTQPKTLPDKDRNSDIRLQAFFKAACARYQNDKKKTLLQIYEEVEALLKAKSLN